MVVNWVGFNKWPLVLLVLMRELGLNFVDYEIVVK